MNVHEIKVKIAELLSQQSLPYVYPKVLIARSGNLDIISRNKLKTSDKIICKLTKTQIVNGFTNVEWATIPKLAYHVILSLKGR